MPTLKQIRSVWKPAAFALCLLPLAWLLLGLAGLGGLDLGPNPIEAIQDHLGIWGLRLILATLAVTPLRLAIGQAWPLQFRRMLGLFAFTYCGLHFLNYLLLDQTADIAAITEDIVERPFITIGFVALLLMVPLAVTSTNGWRRRLGVRWLQLHRLVYVTAMLACWHFYWQVKKDVTEPLIYAVILSVLLGIRLWRRARAGARPAHAR